METEFDDIRPYRDHEISAVMRRLAENESIINGFRSMIWAKCPKPLIAAMNKLIGLYIRLKLGRIKTVRQFQHRIVKKFVKRVVKRSTDGLTFSGFENLEKGKSYLFISNHRDIVLDSAFLDYILMENGWETVEIAFGDNLLYNDLVSDLILANRSFIVKRGLPIMEQLNATKQLSKYIEYTQSLGNHIWIAQREGRAKDGNDATNPAIFTMISLAQRDSNESYSEYMKNRNIVPVSISYEFDPCDRMKGWELFNINKKGEHVKGKHDDIISITKGMTGYKGRVHYTFSKPLGSEFTDDKEITAALDKAIHSSYKLWPSNYIAYDTVEKTTKYNTKYTKEEKTTFLEGYERMSPVVREIVLNMYANPVRNYEAQADEKE